MSSKNKSKPGRPQNRASRKRKQEEDVDPANSLSDPTIASPTSADDNAVAPVPLTEEQEITSIITKRLLPNSDVEDIAEALDSLRELVYSTPDKNVDENRKTAVRRGALITVVQAMRQHANSHELQINGIYVLANICCCELEDFGHDIIAVGGLTYCLEAMGRHGDQPEVQASGCLLIANLWASVDVRKKVVNEGGLKAVIKAMVEYEEHTEVQQWGCHALKGLFIKESSWAKTVVAAGCTALVIAAMNNHPNDADIQRHGCGFLNCLSKAHAKYRIAIIDAKGLVPVVEAQRIHKDNAAVMVAVRAAYAAISA